MSPTPKNAHPAARQRDAATLARPVSATARPAAATARPASATARPPAGRAALASADLRLAAIDVGSNSIHMVVAQVDASGGVTTLWRLKEMVGLGRISFPARRLSTDAMDRAIITLRRFEQVARQRQCEKIIAVATSAVREAENGGDFIERARRELSLSVKVVSGKEEARLIYLGVRHALDLEGGPHLLMDIGGGSVEFIVANEKKPLLLESCKLGSARMTARYIKSDPVSADDLRALLRHYDRELSALCESIRALGPVKAIGTSGTLENLSAMSGGAPRPGDSGAVGQGGVIERDALAKLVARLAESRARDRARMNGLDDKRQDQIVAGALLINEVFGRLDLKRMTVCRSALREGVLVDYLSRHLPELAIRREVPDPRRRSVLDLARRCDWVQSHGEQVAKLTLSLFDALKPLHGLGRAERELIEYGSLLHEIGWHIGASGHHKHSMYLIQHGRLKDFSPREIQIIANIARYHRKSKPMPAHEAFVALPPAAQQTVRVGAALLRIADGLDRSHCGAVSEVRVKIGKRRVRIGLIGRGDVELELWAARRKMDFFTEVFGRTVSFEKVSAQKPARPRHQTDRN